MDLDVVIYIFSIIYKYYFLVLLYIFLTFDEVNF